MFNSRGTSHRPTSSWKNVEQRYCFSQYIAVPLPKKPATCVAQSVIGNDATGVIQMDVTIELVNPRMA